MLLLLIFVLMGRGLEGSLIDLRRCWLIVDLISLVVMILYYEISEHCGGKIRLSVFGEIEVFGVGEVLKCWPGFLCWYSY